MSLARDVACSMGTLLVWLNHSVMCLLPGEQIDAQVSVVAESSAGV